MPEPTRQSRSPLTNPNPFHYIHSEKDILKLANVLITNTDGGQKSGDPFWRNAEMLLYCALMGYGAC